MSWSHDYWPRDKHEEILALVQEAHGGELPAWARAADLVYLHDLAQHPTRPEPVPGRRELQERWGCSERGTKESIAGADWDWKAKAAAAKVRVVCRPPPQRRVGVPASVPQPSPSASPPPSPPPTVEPAESSDTVPATVPASVPQPSPSASPTRARFLSGPIGPSVPPGGEPPPPRPTAPRTTELEARAGSADPLEAAAAECFLRLLDANVAPARGWATLPAAGVDHAQRRSVEELARRASGAGVTPAELVRAASDYGENYWPNHAEILALVGARRRQLAAEEAARQLPLPETIPASALEELVRQAAEDLGEAVDLGQVAATASRPARVVVERPEAPTERPARPDLAAIRRAREQARCT